MSPMISYRFCQTTPDQNERRPFEFWRSQVAYRWTFVLSGMIAVCGIHPIIAQGPLAIDEPLPGNAVLIPSTSPSTTLRSRDQAPATNDIQQVANFFPFQANGAEANNDKAATEEKDASATPPAAPEHSLTNSEAVAAELKSIEKETALDPMFRDRLVEALNSIQKSLTARQSAANRQAAMDKARSTVTVSKAKAKEEAQAALPDDKQSTDRWLPIDRVREERAQATSKQNEAKAELQKIDAEIANRKSRLEKLPEEISKTRQELDALTASEVAEVNDDQDGRLRRVRVAEREAMIAEGKQRLELLQSEQALLEAQTDLLPLQKTAAEKKLAASDAVVQKWSTLLRARRQSQIEADLQSYKKDLIGDGRDPDRSLVLSLSDRWIEVVGETDRFERVLNQEKTEAQNWSEALVDSQKEIEESIRHGGQLTSSSALRLQLLQNRIPSLSHIRTQISDVESKIEESRELQTQLELTLEGVADEATRRIPIGRLTELPSGATELPEAEVKLIEAFNGDLDIQLNKLVDLQTTLEAKRRDVAALSALIDSHVVWIKNQSAFQVRDVPRAWQAFRWIVHPDNLVLLSHRLVEGLWQRLELLAIAVFAILTILFGSSRLRRRISEHGKRASSRQSVTLGPTLAATLLSWALVLPLVSLLWVASDALTASGGAEVLVRAAAKALKMAALAVIPIELLRQCLRSQGLAIAHFEADEASVSGLRRWLRILIDVGLPILVLFVISNNLGRSQAAEALARTCFVIAMVLISLVLWRAFEPEHGIFSARIRTNPDGWLSRLRHVWFVPIVLLPLSFAAVALMGYGNGAIVLIERLYWTLWLCLTAYYIGGLARRWLVTQRRRLTWAVHRERLEAAERLGTSGLDVEPTNTLHPAEINAQTTRLIQTFLFIAALIGVGLIWSPVLPAIRYLEAVPLWSSVSEDGEREQVTLANLVLTMPILFLTWVTVRNLPGLIEGVLLERLPLDKPARYAITTLGTYALMIIGFLVGAQTLGLRWHNIQWLVAALGVGLGFGLQEIFANFISGLILLFEQPIRVGDVVTLGDTTGVVARIRMRATTVTNWDRQELIIPNKDLITGRLVNWTLTDSTNRIVINVGVAYGSDTEQACELLRKICAEHHGIAKDPSPVITFEGFGDSTLNLVVRCFLSTLDDRLLTIHQLHTTINNEFAAAGLEIAFPQRDLHLRSLPPELTEKLGRVA